MKRIFADIDPKWKVYALAACVAVLFYAVVTHLGLCLSYVRAFINFFLPVILGLVIAYVLDPLAKYIGRRFVFFIKKDNIRWTVSSVLALLLVLALLVLLLVSLVPQFIDSIKIFLDNLEDYMLNLETFIDSLGLPSSEIMDKISERIMGDDGILNRGGEYLSNNISKIIKTTTNAGSGMANIVIGIIVALYFLIAKESMINASRRLFGLLVTSDEHYSQTMSVWTRFNEIFSRYIACELLDALIVGLANYAFMLFARMPNALIVACVTGVTNLAPTFGPVVGAVVGSVILLLVKPSSVIPFLIFTVIIQTIDGYIIKPKLFGNVLSVPSSLILVAIIVFGRMMGVLGMLIAIPVAAILVYLYNEILIPKLERRRAARRAKRGAGS